MGHVLLLRMDSWLEELCHQVDSFHEDEDLSKYLEGWKTSCVAIPCTIGMFLQEVMWGEQSVYTPTHLISVALMMGWQGQSAGMRTHSRIS